MYNIQHALFFKVEGGGRKKKSGIKKEKQFIEIWILQTYLSFPLPSHQS